LTLAGISATTLKVMFESAAAVAVVEKRRSVATAISYEDAICKSGKVMAEAAGLYQLLDIYKLGFC